MKLADVPAGAAIFVDANTFVYAFAPDPSLGPPCFEFLQRIAQGDLAGFTSSLVMSDVAHRLMSLEACTTFAWPYVGIANRLKRHPGEIKKLIRFRQALDQIAGSGIHVLPVESGAVLAAGNLSVQHGLLSGDALVLAVMQQHDVTSLASNDADFDRVPGIMRFAPA